MLGPDKVLIRSVGKSGKNRPDDVRTVQMLLNNFIDARRLKGVAKLKVNGKSDKKLQDAIGIFQKRMFNITYPDKRVDAKNSKGQPSRTFAALKAGPPFPVDSFVATLTALANKALGPIPSTPPIPRKLWEFAMDSLAHYSRDLRLKKDTQVALVDFNKPSSEKRLWLVDLGTRTCLVSAFCAHGSGTKDAEGASSGGSGAKFSNISGSNQSSYGPFITMNRGHSNKLGGVKGPFLHLDGLEKTNNKALSRGIHLHGAKYVKEDGSQVGMSHGCFATAPSVNELLCDKLMNGGFLFAYLGGYAPPT